MMRDRDFRIFWIGQSTSWLGGWTQSVAQGWLVWTLTKSPAQLALTAIMVSLPALLFSLFGGLAADRLDRRSLLIGTQGAAIVPALVLGLLTACGAVSASRVLALAFLQGVINAFDVPARQAFLSELVPRERLERAIVLNAVSFNATRMLGPAIAGLTIARFGTAPCFFINAASFLAGVGALLAVRRRGGEGADRDEPSLLPLQDLAAGFRFVLEEPEIRRSLLLVATVSLFGIPFVPLLPVFAEALQVGARGLGVMSACAGSGSLLAALALGGEKRRRAGSALAPGIVFAAALLLFALSTDYRVSLLALLVAGAGVVVFLARVCGSIQHACPDALRGRVMGAYTFALLGMAPLGSALMGCLSARLGAAPALSLTASVCLAALLLVASPLPCPGAPQVREVSAALRKILGQIRACV